MILKNKRKGKFIESLEDATTNKLTKAFNKMLVNFKGVTKLAFGKSTGGSPLDMLIEIGFREVAEILEDATLTSYVFAYQGVATTLNFKINLERVNKQAITEVQKRKEFANSMKKYTKVKLYDSLEQALTGGVSYEDYLKQSEEIFVLSKDRARKIAIHEIGSVYVSSTANAVRDYQLETGAVILKRWNSVSDNRVTEGCQHNESLGYVSQDFIYPNIDGLGGGTEPPRFVGCRCALDYDVQDKTV
jgi:hypothetical protein